MQQSLRNHQNLFPLQGPRRLVPFQYRDHRDSVFFRAGTATKYRPREKQPRPDTPLLRRTSYAGLEDHDGLKLSECTPAAGG